MEKRNVFHNEADDKYFAYNEDILANAFLEIEYDLTNEGHVRFEDLMAAFKKAKDE